MLNRKSKNLVVFINAPVVRGAEISTIELLRMLKQDFFIRIYVDPRSDNKFLTELLKIGFEPNFVYFKKIGRFTIIRDHFFNKFTDSIIWFPHIGQPFPFFNRKRSKKFPVVIGHFRDYMPICPVGCFKYRQNKCCRKCSVSQLISCKFQYNSERTKYGYLNVYNSMFVLGASIIKGAYEYNLINLIKKNLDNMDGFIAISNFLKSIYEKYLPFLNIKPFKVIYNPVIVPEKIINMALSMKLQDDKYLIAYASGFDYVKGFHIFLESVRLVRKVYPRIKVIYLGRSTNRLIKMINKNHLHDVIKILGQLRHEDLLRIIAQTKILVLPSIWPEPFGRIAAEANMLGIPVVASNIGGLPEIIEDGKTGFLVKPGNPLELAKGIIRALEHDFDRKLIHKITYSKFNPQKIKQDFIEYIDNIIS